MASTPAGLLRQATPHLPSIRQLLDIYGVQAKRELSQNFILNESVLKKIISYLQQPVSSNLVIEIGPGPGGLTSQLLRLRPARMIAIEKDQRFEPLLNQLKEAHPENFAFSISDAKDLDNIPSRLLPLVEPRRIQIIGNLPFGVASIILINLLRSISTATPGSTLGQALFEHPNVEFLLMFQKEVAQRIVAKPGNAARTRLSILAQHYCNVELCTVISKESFVPAPEVEAGVVRFVKKPRDSAILPFEMLYKAVSVAFRSPRKMIFSSLRDQRVFPLAEADNWPSEVSKEIRPGAMTGAQFAILAKWLHSYNNSKG